MVMFAPPAVVNIRVHHTRTVSNAADLCLSNNEFEWTTASSNNSFVKDGILYIVPTLTEDVLGAGAITNGYTLNLTTDGTCTSSNVSQCAVVSNSSTGAIINPVQSARLITRDKVSVKYGKVEVTARMPLG
jgi:beta-glucanase (GH16 family)